MSQQLIKIAENVHFIATKDKDRPLFDNLMPLEEGTSYNAYIIKGNDKTALIDTTYPPFINDFKKLLEKNDINKIDYIISLHGEQDHSSALPDLLKKFPNSKIVTNKKCKDITKNYLPLEEEDYIIVNDGDILDLGDKTLEFKLAPWVHWPDTMFAYLKEDKILFSTDFFGAHATNFDTFWNTDKSLIPLIKAYYAELMMPYANFVKKHLAMVENLDLKLIAPAHGPIYQTPQFVIDLYKEWTSSQKQNKVVLIGITMYGSTQEMIDYTISKLVENGIEVAYYNALEYNSSDLASDLVDSKGLIIASPTVLTGPHPAMISPLYLANILKPELSYIGLIGSYSWGTSIAKQVQAMLGNLNKAEQISPVLVNGTMKAEGKKLLDEMITTIKQHHE